MKPKLRNITPDIHRRIRILAATLSQPGKRVTIEEIYLWALEEYLERHEPEYRRG